MLGKLIFNLPEEQEEFEAASKGIHYKCKLEEIWQVFFRGRHKHGYQDDEINDLLGLDSEVDSPESIACNKLMDRLELLYRQYFVDD